MQLFYAYNTSSTFFKPFIQIIRSVTGEVGRRIQKFIPEGKVEGLFFQEKICSL